MSLPTECVSTEWLLREPRASPAAFGTSAGIMQKSVISWHLPALGAGHFPRWDFCTDWVEGQNAESALVCSVGFVSRTYTQRCDGPCQVCSYTSTSLICWDPSQGLCLLTGASHDGCICVRRTSSEPIYLGIMQGLLHMTTVDEYFLSMMTEVRSRGVGCGCYPLPVTLSVVGWFWSWQGSYLSGSTHCIHRELQ